jgi:NADPH-dependent curcumin reductase CurA
VCGLISYYNDGPILRASDSKLSAFFQKLIAFNHLFFHLDQTATILFTLISKRAKIEGFIIADNFDEYPEFLQEILPLIRDGKIKFVEDIIKGIENAPEAFVGLLSGKNFGKLIIEI